MTATERTRAAAVRRAERHAAQARRALAERDSAVLVAMTMGATQREVADATGLSHVGVAKIVARLRRDAELVEA
jgi:DNA-binding NarL/FixJ family response regulator